MERSPLQLQLTGDGATTAGASQSAECLAGERPFFGDTHLHTSASPDAGMFGNKLDRDKAYEFALGKKVTASIGEDVQLRRPLDFIVIADHAESIGLQQAIERSDEGLIGDEFGKRLHDLVKDGKGIEAAHEFIVGVATGTSKKLPRGFSANEWGANLDSAEAYNKPGEFTALIGFEWTSQPGGGNLHRVVILRDGKDRAEQITPFSAYDSEDVEDLWTFMDGYENKTGGRVIAIPHNGNLSSGTMFLPRHQETNQPIDADYARRRQKREPLFEITQIKGHSEAHPLLSPNDEFADFWLLDNSNLAAFKAPTKEMMKYEYVRPGLRRGLELQDQLDGVNPFKFGVVGGTDSHTSLATTDEDAFFGKNFSSEPSKDRWKKYLSKSTRTNPWICTTTRLARRALLVFGPRKIPEKGCSMPWSVKRCLAQQEPAFPFKCTGALISTALNCLPIIGQKLPALRAFRWVEISLRRQMVRRLRSKSRLVEIRMEPILIAFRSSKVG